VGQLVVGSIVLERVAVSTVARMATSQETVPSLVSREEERADLMTDEVVADPAISAVRKATSLRTVEMVVVLLVRKETMEADVSNVVKKDTSQESVPRAPIASQEGDVSAISVERKVTLPEIAQVLRLVTAEEVGRQEGEMRKMTELLS
jgi:hypothetical protein